MKGHCAVREVETACASAMNMIFSFKGLAGSLSKVHLHFHRQVVEL